MEKKNIERQKSVKKSDNKVELILTCGEKNSIRVVTPRYNFEKIE